MGELDEEVDALYFADLADKAEYDAETGRSVTETKDVVQGFLVGAKPTGNGYKTSL